MNDSSLLPAIYLPPLSVKRQFGFDVYFNAF